MAWLTANNDCPICRAPFEADAQHPPGGSDEDGSDEEAGECEGGECCWVCPGHGHTYMKMMQMQLTIKCPPPPPLPYLGCDQGNCAHDPAAMCIDHLSAPDTDGGAVAAAAPWYAPAAKSRGTRTASYTARALPLPRCMPSWRRRSSASSRTETSGQMVVVTKRSRTLLNR